MALLPPSDEEGCLGGAGTEGETPPRGGEDTASAEPTPSLLDGACGESGLPVLLQAQERDHQGDDRDQGARDHQVLDRLAARGRGLVLPLVQADGQRVPVRVLEHDQRQEVVVPRRHDREQGRRNDARSQQGQGNLPERAELGRAVHARRLQQLLGHGLLAEDPHQVQTERADQRRDDHGPRGVRQAQFGEQEELGNRQSDARHADRADDDREHRFAPREAELGQSVAAHDGQQCRAAGADHHVQERVEQPAPEDAVLVCEHGRDVVEQGERLAEAQAERTGEVGLRLRRVDQKVDEREQAVHGEDRAQDGQQRGTPRVVHVREPRLRAAPAFGGLVGGDPLLAVKWQRDNGFIRSLTDSVMDFEYRIQKQAEALERARLLNEQAEQLKKEADKLGKP